MSNAADPTLPPAADETAALPRMGLFDHLDELRRRIGRALIALFLGFLACWGFAPQIYDFLERPIEPFLVRAAPLPGTIAPGATAAPAAPPEGEAAAPPDGQRAVMPPDAPPSGLIFTSVTEPFRVYIRVAALAAIFLTSPFVLYQFWAFVAPGLYRHEKRLAIPFILSGSLLFLAGGAFAYYIAFPFAVEFLLGLGENFTAAVTVSSYLGFLMTVILGLGLMFELPVVIFLLTKLGLVTPRFLMRHFRWAVLIIFIVAAIITPTPDIVNLCVFALPTIVLYLVGVGVAAIAARPLDKPDDAAAEAVAAAGD
ncbi:MAG: twin-arginine translocase subunit TatC [Acidobacteriota bacterium]